MVMTQLIPNHLYGKMRFYNLVILDIVAKIYHAILNIAVVEKL